MLQRAAILADVWGNLLLYTAHLREARENEINQALIGLPEHTCDVELTTLEMHAIAALLCTIETVAGAEGVTLPAHFADDIASMEAFMSSPDRSQLENDIVSFVVLNRFLIDYIAFAQTFFS